MRQATKGSIQKVVQDAFTAAGGIESASDDIGLCVSTLSEHTKKPSGKKAGGLGINYADTLARINPASAAVFAEHFAALAGGTFHSIESMSEPQAMWQHVATMAKETGEAVAALSSIEHGADRAEVRREIIEAREALDAAIRDLDAQNTIPMRGAVI